MVNPPLASTAIGVVAPLAQRHGVGHQQHLPAGRHRHRHRRPTGRCSSTCSSPACATRSRRGPGPASPTGSRSTPTPRAAPGRSRACRAAPQAYLGAFTGALDVILLVAAGVALAGASPRSCSSAAATRGRPSAPRSVRRRARAAPRPRPGVLDDRRGQGPRRRVEVVPMQPLVEHRLELAGTRTRALELEGDGPPVLLLHGYADSADTWRRGARPPGPRRPPRARRRPARLRRLPPRCRRAPCCPSSTPSPRTPSRTSRRGRRRRRRRRGQLARAAASRCAWPSAATCRSPGWRRSPRPASTPRAGSRSSSATCSCAGSWPSPLPLPRGASSARVVGEVYRQLAFARPREARREVVAAFTAHHRDRHAVRACSSTGRRLLAELEHPFRLEEVRVPGAARLGRPRPHGPARGRAPRPRRRCRTSTHVLLEGCGHCPQLEEPERLSALLLAFAAVGAAPRRLGPRAGSRAVAERRPRVGLREADEPPRAP